MKKYLWGMLLALLIATPVSAYVIQSGDTPFGLWGSNWIEEMSEQIGHTDQYNLPVGVDVSLGEDMLGIAPIDVIALYEDNLQNTITSADTTFTLVRGTDKSGAAISGTFGFIIDEGTTLEEFVIATCSGTACSSAERGISVTDGKTEVAALKKAHRKGASIKMTNYPILGRINQILIGNESTGSSTLIIGDGLNTNKTLRFDNGATNTPEMVYDASTNQLKFRRSGETSYTEIPLSLRGTYANYASLPTDASDGDIAITTDDYKLYTYNLTGTTWVLAGGSSGAGTMYKTNKLGSEATGADNRTFDLTAGSWPDSKFLLVYQDGQLMREGATEDYTVTDSNTIVFNYDVADDSLVSMVVVSVDLYNPAWGLVDDDIVPDTDNAYDIGSSSLQFKDVYVTGTIKTKNLSVNGVLATSTPTANAIPIASSTGYIENDWLNTLGYIVVTTTINYSGSNFASGYTTAPAGYTFISGGYTIVSATPASIYRIESYPASATRWNFGVQVSTYSGTMTCYAIALKIY